MAVNELHRARGALYFADAAALNVFSSDLAEGGVTWSPTSEPAHAIRTATSLITAKEMIVEGDLEIVLTKTAAKSNAYYTRMITDCSVGDITYQSVAKNHKFSFKGGVITSAPTFSENMTNVDYRVVIHAYIEVNSAIL